MDGGLQCSFGLVDVVMQSRPFFVALAPFLWTCSHSNRKKLAEVDKGLRRGRCVRRLLVLVFIVFVFVSHEGMHPECGVLKKNMFKNLEGG